jgi:hypothetical protein
MGRVVFLVIAIGFAAFVAFSAYAARCWALAMLG